ncbi:hypothetical protein M1N04_00595 [Peptococcaceae bacterium]|nr:hypothetical protein [Peptococcaceae bacterium]
MWEGLWKWWEEWDTLIATIAIALAVIHLYYLEKDKIKENLNKIKEDLKIKNKKEK